MKKVLLLQTILLFAFVPTVRMNAQITINGSGSYTTIQGAINASTGGDVIDIPAGSYTEVIDINKPLTINGPNLGIPGNGTRVAEAILLNCSIDINNSGSTILDGLHIKRTDALALNQLALDGGTSSTVQNCIFEKVSSVAGINVRAIATTTSGGTKNILNNKITGDLSGGLFGSHRTWNNGIYVDGGTYSVNISGNTIMNCRTAINLDDYNNGVSLSSNTFDNCGTMISFGGAVPTNGQFILGSNDFKNPVDAIINLSNVNVAFRLDITSSTINGTSFSSLPLSSLFLVEATMYHRGRSGTKNGLVYYVANNIYVLASPTINNNLQTAVNYATAGDIINAQAGIYTQTLTINKKVSIIGQGSGLDGTIITKAGGSNGVLNLSSSGNTNDPILLKDIRIEPQGCAGISVGTFSGATANNISWIKLENVKVMGSSPLASACTEQERGLYVDLTSNLSNIDITNCAFDNLHYGWYLHKLVSADASNVSNVMVTNTSFSNNIWKGIYAEKLSDATFDGCTIYQNGRWSTASSLCSYFLPNMAGFDINLKAGTYQNLNFLNSIFSNNGLGTNGGFGTSRDGVGLAIKARGSGTDASYLAFPASLTNVNVANCFITGNERGMRLGEPGKSNTFPTNVIINNNSITNNDKTYPGSDGSPYGEIVNLTTISANAECNWFGSSNSLVIATKIVGPVDYTPWLTSGGDISPSTTGFQPEGTCNGVDSDNDGVIDSEDNCPTSPNSSQLDSDSDGVGDVCDNCPTKANPNQLNTYGGPADAGDVCDDTDNDGVVDAYDCSPLDKKNKKWLVCHSGTTICVSQSSLQAHINHGDQLGSCGVTYRGEVVDIVDVTDEFKINVSPNPIISTANIKYELPVDAKVSIVLFDPQGKVVNTLVNADRKAGVYNYQLDASKLPAGIYYYRMTAIAGDQQFVQGQKLMIVK